MGLAGEDELEAASGQERVDAGRVAEDEVAPLVGGGASGEAERQDVGIEMCPGAECDRREELELERPVCRPEPGGRSARFADAGVLPGRHVDAVGDRDDGTGARDRIPHAPRDLAVQRRDRVRPPRQPETGDRHAERIAADLLHLPVDELAARPKTA